MLTFGDLKLFYDYITNRWIMLIRINTYELIFTDVQNS